MKLASLVLLVFTGVLSFSVCPGVLGGMVGLPSTYVLCEHSKGRIHCPLHYTIEILYANYGRRTRHICPSRWMKTTRCLSRPSLIKVRRACQGKGHCGLYASNRVFGDPCHGTYKYLQVTYRCKRRPLPSPPSAVFFCEHSKGRIHCPPWHQIKVLLASYGRTNRYICPSRAIRSTRCHSTKSLSVVRRACENKRECRLQATNRLYGDPCRGTYKYLKVVYRCMRIPRPPPPPPATFRICEHRRGILSCGRRKILVVSANYGRTTRHVCPSRFSRNTNCRSRRSTHIVRGKCNKRRSCLLIAGNHIFGDPCFGTYKYLEVRYRCV